MGGGGGDGDGCPGAVTVGVTAVAGSAVTKVEAAVMVMTATAASATPPRLHGLRGVSMLPGQWPSPLGVGREAEETKGYREAEGGGPAAENWARPEV